MGPVRPAAGRWARRSSEGCSARRFSRCFLFRRFTLCGRVSANGFASPKTTAHSGQFQHSNCVHSVNPFLERKSIMRNGRLQGKVAVVTGASKGIGAGIAKHLAAEGAAVVVNYASSKESADRVVDEISKRGAKAIAVQADVAKKKDIERLFAETKKAFGKVDILVNNAGGYDFKRLEVVTESELHREFNTNVLGLVLATQEAVKH